MNESKTFPLSGAVEAIQFTGDNGPDVVVVVGGEWNVAASLDISSGVPVRILVAGGTCEVDEWVVRMPNGKVMVLTDMDLASITERKRVIPNKPGPVKKAAK